MKPCSNCGHTVASHRGYHPEVVNREGCLVEGCDCLQFVRGDVGNSATMPPEKLKAELARRAARIHRIVNDELKEMQALIDRHTS